MRVQNLRVWMGRRWGREALPFLRLSSYSWRAKIWGDDWGVKTRQIGAGTRRRRVFRTFVYIYGKNTCY